MMTAVEATKRNIMRAEVSENSRIRIWTRGRWVHISVKMIPSMRLMVVVMVDRPLQSSYQIQYYF